jgi:hypothetical protein
VYAAEVDRVRVPSQMDMGPHDGVVTLSGWVPVVNDERAAIVIGELVVIPEAVDAVALVACAGHDYLVIVGDEQPELERPRQSRGIRGPEEPERIGLPWLGTSTLQNHSRRQDTREGFTERGGEGLDGLWRGPTGQRG